MTTAHNWLAQAEAMNEELIIRRRDLHQHPELGFEEVRTAGIVAQELRDLGLEVQTGVGKTGVIGMLEGGQDGPTVLVRADMDALPIHEENDFAFKSGTAGKMHACGHDGHTTIALAVAKLLSRQREKIAGRVKFVFQPAEEIVSGAKAMIADGVLTDPRPDVTLGLHLWNSMPVGQVGVVDGAVMAGSAVFRLTVTGRGSHGAMPHQGIDPVVCAAQIIGAFQTIVSRNLDPLDGAVVSVTWVHAGTAYNIIPEQIELRGTVRTFKVEVREVVLARMRAIVDGVCAAMGCTGELNITYNTLPVRNDATVAERARQVFKTMLAPEAILTDERSMVAEDVGLLMDDIPGLFFLVGAAVEGRDAYYGHHHPRFDFDERALPLSVSLLAAAVADYLGV